MLSLGGAGLTLASGREDRGRMAYSSGEVDLGLTSMQATPGAACVVGTTKSTSVWYVSNAYLGGLTLGSAVIDAVEQGACAVPGRGPVRRSRSTGGRVGLADRRRDGPRRSPRTRAGEQQRQRPQHPARGLGGRVRQRQPGHQLGVAGATAHQGRRQPGDQPVDRLVSVGRRPGPGTASSWSARRRARPASLSAPTCSVRDVTDGTWVAAYQTRITQATEVAAAVPGLPDLGITATCDWFPVGDTDANGPVGYLAIGLNPSSGGPVIGYLEDHPWTAPGCPTWTPRRRLRDRLGGEGPAAVARDPAGGSASTPSRTDSWPP